MSLPNHQAPKGRPVGVMKTHSQMNGPGEEGYSDKKNALLNCVEAKSYAIEIADQNGKKKVLFVMCIGGTFYRPPNAEQYASELVQIDEKHWLHKALMQKLADAKETATPKEDAVDILQGGGE